MDSGLGSGSGLSSASVQRKRTRQQWAKYYFDLHKEMKRVSRSSNPSQSEESTARGDQNSGDGNVLLEDLCYASNDGKIFRSLDKGEKNVDNGEKKFISGTSESKRKQPFVGRMDLSDDDKSSDDEGSDDESSDDEGSDDESSDDEGSDNESSDDESSGNESNDEGSDSDVVIIGEAVASNATVSASALNTGSGSGSWSNVGSVRESSPKFTTADEVVSSTSSMNGRVEPVELRELSDSEKSEDFVDAKSEEVSDTTESSEPESEASTDEDNDDPGDKDYRVKGKKKKGRAYLLRSRSLYKPSNKKQRLVNSSGIILLSDDEESESSSEGDINPLQDDASKERKRSQKKTSASSSEGVFRESVIPVQDDAPKPNNRRKPLKKKKKRIPKDFDFVKFVVNSIINADDDKLSCPKEREHVPAKKGLPLKFRFEDEDPVPREKEEWEKEVDELFAEMDMGILESCIGFTNTSFGESDNIFTGCQMGNHHVILDEQIGLICKLCSHVYLESKYLFPPFAERTSGRHEKKYYGEPSPFLDVRGFRFDDSSAVHDSAVDVEGTVWELVPRNARETMYPHQRDGFEFMWKQIAGDISLEKLREPQSPSRGGCIISHPPGTGKTRLTLVFLQAFLKQFPKGRPVIITPPKLLSTWEAEFKKWEVDIPFHNLNSKDFSCHEDEATLSVFNCFHSRGKQNLSDKQIRHYRRLVKLKSWTNRTSILGISYTLFDKLTRENDDGCAKEIREILLKYPGLLVLEEGHTPRNEQSHMFKAVRNVETEKRILLSGTPFQNNFKELYNTLCVVSPRFAAGLEQKWASVTNSIDKNVQALEGLRDIIAPLVHVCSEDVKNQNLPGIRATVIRLKPTDSQKNLLGRIQENPGSFYEENLLSLISVHPSLVANKEEFSDLKSQLKERGFRLDPNTGVKMKFIIELIRLCGGMRERVIIFSQLLAPLKLIKEQLNSLFHWTLGSEILYMDGSLDIKQRQTSIDSLNDPKSDVKVLLASIKACSEGINLIGASRVVLLDVLWNPSVERQAISRAYRTGQTKFVHVYHLVAVKSEIDKMEQQTRKKRHSDILLCRNEVNNCKIHSSSSVSEDKILEAMFQHESLHHIFERLTPGIL